MANPFFYTTVIGCVSGIFFRSFFDMGIAWVLFLITLALGCIAAWVITQGSRRSLLVLVALAFVSFALGVFRLDISAERVSLLANREGSDVFLSGVVVREPEIGEKTTHLYMREDTTRETLLVTTDRFQDIQYGDRIAVEGTLKKPEAFETDLGRTFNYEGFLKARGVTHTVQFAEVDTIAHGEGNLILAMLFEGKHAFLRALEGIIPEPAEGLGEGLLLGVKALGSDHEDVFRQVGIIHIVVLSGYNIMIVVVAVMWVLSFFFLPRVRMGIGLCVIALFAILVGLSATVLRASIMAALLIVARATGRTYAIVRALTLAGLIMLVVNPYLLAFDPGFQLSFLATLGLIFLAPRINERLRFVPSFGGAREFLTATIATQIFVLPLLLYQMGIFSVVAVVANVLVLPAVPFAMLFVFVTGVASFLVPWVAVLMGFVAYLLLTYIIAVAEVLAAVPYASVSVPMFPFWVVILAYALLALLLSFTNAKEIEEEFEALEQTNEYADWTIEEVSEQEHNHMLPPATIAVNCDSGGGQHETATHTSHTGGGTYDPFPFR